jgi:hypothetical protein
VLAANGHTFEREDEAFKTILSQSSASVPVHLVVYNLRDERTRLVQLAPQVSSSGQQVVGISIRFTDFQTVYEHVWHVLDVYPRSPAVDAGLVARSDFIVGTPDLQFTDSEDFFTYVEANMGQAIRLYVFSAATDSVRLVSITPNNQWGGHGCLGCDVGFGYLHRIPKRPQSAAARALISGDDDDHHDHDHHGHSHAHGHSHSHSHSHAPAVPQMVRSTAAVPPAEERRLHPLMIPTAGGFQAPPTSAAAPTAATLATAAPTIVDAVGGVARAPTTAAPVPTPQFVRPSFITMSDDELNKPPPGPPPTTPYVGAAPKQQVQQQAPPTRFLPLGTEPAAVPAAIAVPAEPVLAARPIVPVVSVAPIAPTTSNGAAAHEPQLAPLQAAPFQLPPDADGDMFSNIQL